VVVESQPVERHDAFLPVEDAQDDVLAVNGRLRRNAEIDGTAADVERDAAVLRRTVSAMFMRSSP